MLLNQAYELVDVDRLTPHPDNPRHGNVDVIVESVEANGFYGALVVQRSTGYVLAGNHRLLAAQRTGLEQLPVTWVDVDDDRARRILLVDNRANDLADYDEEALADLLSGLPDLVGTGYTQEDLAALLEAGAEELPPALADPDRVPDIPVEPVSKLGDLWLLGPHRLLCGDSTDPAAVLQVVDGATVTLIHADPPYGMGKEADGVLNDNLYGPKLDEFQMQWWNAWQPTLAENASAYIWGNAPDLWRLWWIGGLSNDPDLLVRNEIVWDKGSAIGMRSEGGHSYPVATERCLFLMRGEQFLGNQNKDDFWEGYEPLRAWLCAERDKVGWANRDVNQLTGTQMSGHWFTQSQFAPIPLRYYKVLQDAACGRAFTKDYDDLFREMFPDVRAGGNAHRRELSAKLREQRTFFDNAHDIMSDVWAFPRVHGDERQGHATPKPVGMVERALKSSSQRGEVVGVPFGGSGPDFIAAHRLGRVCVGIELEPRYVDVIARRYQEATGTKPVLASTGEPHDFTA